MSTEQLTVIGIDVSKRTLEICLEEHKKSFTIDNHSSQIQKLIESFPPPGTCAVILEATGGYHLQLVHLLLEHHHLVAVVNPRRVRDLARGLGMEAKTDQIDAQLLVRFGKQAQPRLVQMISKKQVQLQFLSLRRRQLVEFQIAEKNRRDTCQTQLVERSIHDLLKTLDKQIQQIDQEIEKLIDNDDYWKEVSQLLTSIPGVAKGTAHRLLAELPELGQLNRTQIASLVGVAPFNKDSGPRRGKRSIRGGRESIRSALYMAGHNARLHCPRFRAYFQKLRQEGKPYKVALIAVVRKLLVTMNTMVKNNTHWNPQNA